MNSLGIYMESELEPETHVDGGPQEPKNSASEGDEDDDENFMELLDQLGGQNVFQE